MFFSQWDDVWFVEYDLGWPLIPTDFQRVLAVILLLHADTHRKKALTSTALLPQRDLKFPIKITSF